ncbi:MAG: hypothetical protein D6696_05990 [Acidobacteria bacterium]|nr:MAG: hypothetical protein D6696_05990 [Acidobacteriota bacterium]
MSDLPAGLGEPLHLLEPLPHRALVAAGLALLLLAWWAWLRWRRRPAAAEAPPPAAAEGGVDEAIEAIRRRYGRPGRFRVGCHALAGLLRRHVEGTSGRRLAHLTAREIAAAFGEQAVAGFFPLLAELQFRRREPSADEFHSICELAEAVAVSGLPPRPGRRR